MSPALFGYHRPDTIQTAVGLLSQFGDRARIMAGGQSVIPTTKLRMGEASELVYIGRILDISYVKPNESVLQIGVLTTHALIAASEDARKAPLLAQAASGIADRQIRSMGTIGGGETVAHRIACWPTSLLKVDSKVQIIGPQGSRSVAKENCIWGRLAYAMMRLQTAINRGNNARIRSRFRSK